MTAHSWRGVHAVTAERWLWIEAARKLPMIFAAAAMLAAWAILFGVATYVMLG